MKTQLKMLSLLVVLVAGTFMATINLFFFAARATYVEGDITQDTVWTLIDSPFVVVKDIIIKPGATLTILPGVVVKFGGFFSLVVEGGLDATGTQGNWINFTSNKISPVAGDWNTIEFKGTQPSTLVYCLIEYATNGATIQNGNIQIRDSQMRYNALNGVAIENANAEIRNSKISNSANGVYITGSNQANIRNNTIQSNQNGIFLTGDSVSGVDIRENRLISNNQSGIQLAANAYANTVILYNNLSANGRGFFVSGQATTYITNNSISYNTMGILYEQGTGHVAHYNDIYGNTFGMDVSLNASVNAEYNYWGDSTGPYHISLNPAGKGNPVGGDGIDLDFIPFLTAPISYINQRPIARLTTDKSLVMPNQPITFDASTSSDDGSVDKYFFNFGYGISSGWTTLSAFVYKYSLPGTYNASVMVMDDFGVTSSWSNVVTITVVETTSPLKPLSVSLSLGKSIIDSGEQVSISVHVANGTSVVANARVKLVSNSQGSFQPSSEGNTNSAGDFTATFIAPSITVQTNIRIVATASKAGYLDGSDDEFLRVVPFLSVTIDANPISKSEATSNVIVLVTDSVNPVANASVLVSATRGNFSVSTGKTDANGVVTFFFNAPQTSVPLNITITADAIKSGYIAAESQTKITVEPKVLLIDVVANPTSVNSEMASNVTVHVTYDSNPISSAAVTLASDNGGSFSPLSETTDTNGDRIFTFTAPRVTAPINITITARATKASYGDGMNRITIPVNLGTPNVQVTASPATVDSKATSTVVVHVTYNAKPVVNASVTMSAASGNFAAATGTTDANGDARFVFTAPETTTAVNASLTATVTKTGYINAEGQMGIMVNPVSVSEPISFSGLPLTTILLIVIPIVVVVIVVVLIKAKIIVFGGEES